MAYQALYRKWRPRSFDEVKGQDAIVRTLKNQINTGRVSHAYLFTGTRGTGKTSVAKIFAKAVNCEHPVDGSPCGECAICKAIDDGSSMNVIEIDAASNNGVDNIREIRDEVQYSPTEGKYKVYIIDEVHMLSPGAFNALLKTLEEPPEYVIFILATTEVQKIPITILSRCQRYDFHRITADIIADRLSELMVQEGRNVEEKAIRYVAKAADGSMRDALSLLDQCLAFYMGTDLKYENVLDVLGAVDTSVYTKMLHYCYAYDTAEVLKLLDDVLMTGRELPQFVADFIWYLRNILIVDTTADESKLEDVIDMSADNLEQLKKDAKEADIDTILRYIRVLSNLETQLKVTTQKRVAVEVALIKCTRPAMEQAKTLEDLNGRVIDLENQLNKAARKIKELENRKFVAGDAGVSGVAGGTGAAPVKKEPKKKILAVSDDLRKIVENWNNIVDVVEQQLPMYGKALRESKLTSDEQGRKLIIAAVGEFRYNAINEGLPKIKDVIEDVVSLTIDIDVIKMEDESDFERSHTDVQELVGMPIVADEDVDEADPGAFM